MYAQNNLHHVRSKQPKYREPNNLKVFGSKKTKGPIQDSQNRLWSPMPEGGEHQF
jgi:hypothetical protein